MRKGYQVCGVKDSRPLAEFLAKEGQLLFPMLDLIGRAEAAVDEVIDVAGRAALEAILLMSAQEAASPKHPGKAGGGVRWHGRQRGVVTLSDRKVRVEKPRTAPFVEINQHRADHAGAETVSFAYNPASHLPDDDTFMENRSAAADQVRTIRSFAPKARVRVGPITLDSPYPRAGRDPRNRGLFAAAWAAGLVGHLALAGADEAVFCVGPGPVDEVLREMGALRGRAVLQADAAAGDSVVPEELLGEWRSKLIGAAARLQKARSVHEREKALLPKQASSQAEYEEAQRALRTAAEWGTHNAEPKAWGPEKACRITKTRESKNQDAHDGRVQVHLGNSGSLLLVQK